MRAIIALSLFIALSPAARAGKVEMCVDEACAAKVNRQKLDCTIHKNKSKALKFGFKLSVAFAASVGPEVTFGRRSEINWNRMSQELIRRYEELCDMHNKGLLSVAVFDRRYEKLESYFDKAKDLKEEVEDTVEGRAEKEFADLDKEVKAHERGAEDIAKGKERVKKIKEDIDELSKEVTSVGDDKEAP